MKKKSLLVFVVCMILLVAACSNGTNTGSSNKGSSSSSSSSGTNSGSNNKGSEQVYQLRTSTNLAATGTIGMALTYFVDLVNERADGRINATANFGSELGTQGEQVEMTQTGSLEMVVAAPGTALGVWVPQFGMFEFPYLFEDNEHYRRVLAGMTDEVTRLVSPHGFVAASGQSQGARNMFTVKPVETLDDIKGVVMRGPNQVYIDMFEALGAAGVTTDWTEIYTSIQTNVIEGLESAPSSAYSMNFHEVAPYMTVTNHIIANTYYFFNKEWLESLPQDLRDIVLEAAEEAAVYQAEIDDEDQSAALKSMVDAGLTVIVPKDPLDWVEATSGMLAEYRTKGDDWNDFIDKLLAIK